MSLSGCRCGGEGEDEVISIGIAKDEPAILDDEEDSPSVSDRANLDLLRSGAPRVSALRRSMFNPDALFVSLVGRLDDMNYSKRIRGSFVLYLVRDSRSVAGAYCRRITLRRLGPGPSWTAALE